MLFRCVIFEKLSLCTSQQLNGILGDLLKEGLSVCILSSLLICYCAGQECCHSCLMIKYFLMIDREMHTHTHTQDRVIEIINNRAGQTNRSQLGICSKNLKAGRRVKKKSV